MQNRIALPLAILACVFMPGLITSAMAGEVRLVSDTWETVCGVEISWGPNAPDESQSEHFHDVEEDWSVSKPGRLCYRRASTPDNCDSGMTQWKTPWRCAENDGDGIEELSLE